MWLRIIPQLLLVLSLVASSQQCPDLYKRYSSEHTFCLPPNNACKILKRGVNAKDKELIVKVHNDFRNRIATGKETDGGGMPPATNMLEMVWDNELAAVAQKLAETCNYDHDCNNCRRVQAFSAGQNIGLASSSRAPESADWQRFIKGLYSEVSRFNRKLMNPYVPGPHEQDTQYGHFTQIAWATSWKVGCGWALYKEGSWYQSYTVCNYGPGGNVRDGEMYKEGPTCSACPKNSCCGNACKKNGLTTSYPGLCKVIDTASSPEGPGPHDAKKYSLYCDFNNQPDCAMTVEGKSWKVVRTPGGNWLSIVLNGGEKTKLTFNKKIGPKGKFCTKVVARTAPNVDGQAEGGQYVVNLDVGRYNQDFKLRFTFPKSMRQQFLPQRFGYMNSGAPIKYTFTYSVPAGTPPQFFEIKEFSAYDGPC